MAIELGPKEGEWRRGPGPDPRPARHARESAIADPGSRVRIGVVGCGYWGSKHVRVLSSLTDVEAVAVIDTDPRSSGPLLAAFPAATAFPDLDAALAHVDAVVIATPPRTHAALALRALRHGKHVLVEKPLATSLAEARLLVTEAARVQRVLMVGHTFEFNPAVRALRRRLDQGELGEIYYLHSARLNLGLYQPDVNVLWDLAPHDVSILNYLLRSLPTTVTAWGSSNNPAGIEDLAYVRLHYGEIGVTGYVHVSWLDPKKIRQVTVVGSDKMAIYNELDAEERLRIFDRGVDCPDPGSSQFGWPLSYRYGDIISPHIQFDEPLAVEDRHFVDCIRERRTPDADGRNGMAVVAVLEAAERSLRTGAAFPVELAPPTPAPGRAGALSAAEVAP